MTATSHQQRQKENDDDGNDHVRTEETNHEDRAGCSREGAGGGARRGRAEQGAGSAGDRGGGYPHGRPQVAPANQAHRAGSRALRR